ncbi:MAG: hypothetical protein HUU08_07750 [Candidatus Brocadia sp.]|nr:hypothetical protein [Candidatus Brocadia sp.]
MAFCSKRNYFLHYTTGKEDIVNYMKLPYGEELDWLEKVVSFTEKE